MPDSVLSYPLVPTREQLAHLTLDERERTILAALVRRRLKGVPISSQSFLLGCLPGATADVLAGLREKGALVGDDRADVPMHAYLAEVLLGCQDMVLYTYHAESRARLKIMWQRALDRADAAGEPVEWAGHRPGGADDSIPVPEVTQRVEDLYRQANVTRTEAES